MATSPDKEQFYTEIGRLAMHAAALDGGMAVLLARLMSPSQASFDMSFPSIFMFSARSMEQRMEIVRKTFAHRCHGALKAAKHTNSYRASAFLEKAMNTIFENIMKNKWLRNTAVHGSFIDHGQGIVLMPHIFDHEGWKSVKRRGQKYKDGITIPILKEAVETTVFDSKCLSQLGQCLWFFLDPGPGPSEFLARANGLAQDLKLSKISLRDPREAPPMRQRRQSKGRPAPEK